MLLVNDVKKAIPETVVCYITTDPENCDDLQCIFFDEIGRADDMMFLGYEVVRMFPEHYRGRGCTGITIIVRKYEGGING